MVGGGGDGGEGCDLSMRGGLGDGLDGLAGISRSVLDGQDGQDGREELAYQRHKQQAQTPPPPRFIHLPAGTSTPRIETCRPRPRVKAVRCPPGTVVPGVPEYLL